MNIPAIAYFLALIFVIPSLGVAAYALIIYKAVSTVKSKIRILIPFALALVLAALTVLQAKFSNVNSAISVKLLGYLFMFVYVTEMAAGMVTPIFVFEGRTTYGQRKYMLIAFSAILTILFMRAFAIVMGTPSSTIGLLGLLDYRAVLKLGKNAFHFISAILPYFEIAGTSAIFYAICYGLIVLKRPRLDKVFEG
jgi:hypothetical protein